MRAFFVPLAVLCGIFLARPANAAPEKTPEKMFYAEAGTMNGFGLNAGFGLHRISPKFPIGFDFSAGYVFQSDPGNAVEARRIFINDATGGNNNIVESGSTFFMGVDALYPIMRQSILELNVAAGPRYSSYAAFFDYQGGNEAFKVYANAWGFGVGLKSLLTISDHFVIGLETTVEYFFQTQLKGHGFFYNANNQDDNPRNNYRYSDADAAIDQPLFFPRVQLLLGYKF